MAALPWVLLGKRVQFQPHLDASASQMVLGKNVKIPGQLLGQAGPPLNNAQTRALLDQLYQMADKPPVQTSSPVTENNIDNTLLATHVYVKRANPLSLQSKFEGPFEIKRRTSRSTIDVKIGTHADGRDRLLNFHWSSCKIAHMREGASAGSRPMLGRKPHPSGSEAQTILTSNSPAPQKPAKPVVTPPQMSTNTSTGERGKIQTRSRPQRSTRNPNPLYVDSLTQ